MIHFPFLGLPGKSGKTVYKPIIPVSLAFRNTHRITSKIYALVDTGADVCFCHKDIGMFLRVNFSKKPLEYFKAANNQEFPTQREQIRIHLGNSHIDCPFYFTDTLPRENPIILGEKGFLNRFKVVFDYINKSIQFE